MTSFQDEDLQYADSEAAMWDRLCSNRDHPNIVQLLGVREESEGNKRFLFLMPLADATLSNCINNNNEEIPVPVSKRVIYDVIAGLAYLHSEGICHGDIKRSLFFRIDSYLYIYTNELTVIPLPPPSSLSALFFFSLAENILLIHGRAQLADFSLWYDCPAPRQRQPGGFVQGTPGYRSPESFAFPEDLRIPGFTRDDGEAGGECPGIEGPLDDVWAAGCVAYRLLVGYFFVGMTSQEVLPRHVVNVVEKARIDANFTPQDRLRFVTVDNTHLTITGSNFLHSLLCRNFLYRATSSSALSHDWFIEHPTMVEK